MESDAPRVTFSVRNAGRSRTSAALVRREADRRDLDVEAVTGGPDPADAVRPGVVEVTDELNVDLSGREPREIPADVPESYDPVATMGCSTLELDADTDVRDWAPPDPDGADLDRVREVPDEAEAGARSSTNSDETAVEGYRRVQSRTKREAGVIFSVSVAKITRLSGCSEWIDLEFVERERTPSELI